VATESLRNSRLEGSPTASAAGVVTSSESTEGLICFQVRPASVDRHTPRAYDAA